MVNGEPPGEKPGAAEELIVQYDAEWIMSEAPAASPPGASEVEAQEEEDARVRHEVPCPSA